MNGIINILQYKPGERQFYLVVLFLAVIMFFLACGAAINIDEIAHNQHAKKVINWYATLGVDGSCLEPGTNNLNYYSQLPDNLSALVNRLFSIENEYLTRHLTGLIFAIFLLIGAGLLAVEFTGSFSVGILAVVLMFISPRIMGQAYGNLKDIPFAAGYAWSLLFLIRVLKTMPVPGWKNILYLGGAIAFTNSVRIGGLVLFGYLAIFVAIYMLEEKGRVGMIFSLPRVWKPLALKLATVILIGYLAGLIFWPYGLVNPLKNPVEALSVMEHYKISIRQIFEGTQIWSTNLPWYYLPKWMLISIPEVVIIGFVLFPLFSFIKRRLENKPGFWTSAPVWFALLFPLVYVIAIKSNVYSDWRQMYFVYPPLVAISSVGLIYFYNSLKRTSSRLGLLVLALGLVLLPIVNTIRTYPSDYIYFNTLAGRSKSCWENYEYDYYRHEMKKAAGWLRDELNTSGKEVTVASNFDIGAYFPNDAKIKFRYVHFYDKMTVQWDYALFGVNFVHPYQLKNNTWQPAGIKKIFYHKGNPTVVILKGQDKNVCDGFAAFMDKNYGLADSLLLIARRTDPNDICLLACLGESSLDLNRYRQLDEIIADGKKLNPFYEPFIILDAKKEMKQGNYQRGLEILDELTAINPRYFNAVPYIIECYEKTGQTEKARQFRKFYDV